MRMYSRKTSGMSWFEWLDQNSQFIYEQATGLVLMLAGIGATVLSVLMIVKTYTNDNWDYITTFFLSMLFLIMFFCLIVGYRLLFLKPNKYGSILGPFGWTGMSIFWGAIALMLFWAENPLIGLIASAACIWCAFHAVDLSKQTTHDE